MKIGCEFHAIKDWFEYDDSRIESMDSDALDFWETSKAMLQSVCSAHGRV
jgi:hypothetical protein